VSYLLRKITRKKWDPNMETTSDLYTADAITGCTRTASNTLSVWYSKEANFDGESSRLLITALASSMDRPDAIDLLWLEELQLKEKGIIVEESEGSSKCKAANNLHKDLVNLKHKDLAVVGEHIVHQLRNPVNHKRISRASLLSIMLNAVLAKRVDFYDLSDKWQEKLFEKMDAEQKNQYPYNKPM